MKCDELFKECLSKVDPEIRTEVRRNMEKKLNHKSWKFTLMATLYTVFALAVLVGLIVGYIYLTM